MRRKFRSTIDVEDHEEPIINLTPLIDVVFVVLITFILIAPVLEVDSVDLAQGGQIEKKELKQSQISISVHEDNSIFFKGTKVSLAELKNLLKLEKKKNIHTVPQIFHDQKAQFGTYQSIKNALEAAGFNEMDVILKPQ